MSSIAQWLSAALADVSPKVKAGLNWGVIASLVLSLLNSITPEMLAPLGKYEPLVWALIPVVAAGVAAWAKTDQLRDAGKAALAKAEAEAATIVPVSPEPKPVDPQPAPEVPAPPAA